MRRFLIGWLAACVVLGAVWTARAEQTKVNEAIVPVPRDGGWLTRHERMNARVKQGNVRLVFIGDSITQGWESSGRGVWRTFYGQRQAVNLGISGDRTQHVLWRLDHGNIDGIAPKLAVLMIGTNNSGVNTAEEIAEGVAKIVEKLRTKLPDTKILVLAIFPRGPNNDDPQRKVNQAANQLIAKLADGKNVMFLDIAGRFTKPDGTLSRDVMPDLLHLTPAAYQAWAEAIEPIVAKTLSEARSTKDKEQTTKEEPADDQGFVALFDGKTLAGWTKRGGEATYTVEDGCIVGRVGPGGNTFLCSDKNYGDFVLKLDLKLDVPVNSGIQIRSHARRNGRVFGYQCEVDPSPRGWSGGIYDEARRAWLATLDKNEPAQKAFKPTDWNAYTIRCKGPRIQTWVNGVPCADLIDDVDATGFIALQVHAAKEGQIRWRNVRVKELGE